MGREEGGEIFIAKKKKKELNFTFILLVKSLDINKKKKIPLPALTPVEGSPERGSPSEGGASVEGAGCPSHSEKKIII